MSSVTNANQKREYFEENFSRKVVKEKLKDSTVITIAHRLNTITDCEVILIMKNGEIDEIDSFEPLINDML